MIANAEVIPETGESFDDFVERVHEELGNDFDTDTKQQIAFDAWDEGRPDPLISAAQRRFAPDKFTRVRNVPIFAEHTTVDGEGHRVIYDRNALAAIAKRCNDRIADTGDFSPLTDGHTPDKMQLSRGAKHPDVLGYAGPYRLGKIGNKTPRWAIFGDEWHHNESRDRLARLRRRSPEVWLEERMEDRILDPIAALGAETPRLDMGLTKLCRLDSGREIQKYQRYSASFPGGMNTSIPSDKYESGSNMISPEDIDQIVAALMETQPMQWVVQQMSGGSPQSLTDAGAPGAGLPPAGGAPGAPPAPPAAAPPAAPAPDAGGPPPGLDGGAPPDDTADMDDEEKQHYMCMDDNKKKSYMSWKQTYSAEGSADNETADKSPTEGNVEPTSKNSRAGEKDRYARIEKENKDLRADMEKLKKDSAAKEKKLRETERYSRLKDRRREYEFDLQDEWSMVKEYPDAVFENHVEKIIVENYRRLPIDVELDHLSTEAIDDSEGQQKQLERVARRAVEITQEERRNGKQNYSYRDAVNRARKEIGVTV